MKTTNLILLSIFICVSGIVFILACGDLYTSRNSELKQRAKEAFAQALEEELKNRDLKEDISFTSEVNTGLVANMPDTVYIKDEIGQQAYWLDPNKVPLNITPNIELRVQHSYVFWKNPLSPDSLHVKWKKYLLRSDISNQTALCISVTDKKGNIKSSSIYQDTWCTSSSLLIQIYMGYACEIEILGYFSSSVWKMICPEVFFYLVLYILGVSVLYKVSIVIWKKYLLNHKKK